MSDRTTDPLCPLCWKRHPSDAQCIGLLEPQPMPDKLPDPLHQTTQQLSPRQRTIRDAEEWLSNRLPAGVPSEERHAAAVRIANIVLGLELNEAVARQFRGHQL